MQEYVGTCEQCHRPIYCMDGFFRRGRHRRTNPLL